MTNFGKEFAFTKLITCGLCGSGVTADEKFKKQLNGNTHHYIYYGCGRHKDQNCKSGYIREEELIEQLAILIDKLDLDEIGMKQKIKETIEQHKKFQSGLLGEKPRVIKTTDIDIRNYAKYILRDGTMEQKREMLTCLKSKIQLANKKISIA
jgi:hypothetical protein